MPSATDNSPAPAREGALLSELARAFERNPAPFDRDLAVAIGTGSETAPIWLRVELSANLPARTARGCELHPSCRAALFLPSNGSAALVAGDRRVLETVFRHYLGGVNLLGLRVDMRAAP